MTDDFDVRLRMRLEQLSRAVPVAPERAPGTTHVVRPRVTARPSSGALTVGFATLFIVAAVVLVSGPIRSPATGGTTPSAASETESPPTPTPVPSGNAHQIADIVAAYGTTVPEDWAGLYIDQDAGGRVVARFKANLAEHEQALRALLPAGANFEVHPATWSTEELGAFMTQVEAERDWFPTIGTSFYTVEPGNVRDFNGVRVLFKGPDASAAAAIEAHFGNPPWLRAVWYGPEEWTGARGDLVIFARDAADRPVAGLTIGLVSLDERVRSGELAWMTNKDGRRILVKNLPAVFYLVRATDYVGGELVVLGEARVLIDPNGRTTVTVVIR